MRIDDTVISGVIKAMQGLTDLSPYKFDPTLPAFGGPHGTKAKPEPVPKYEPFDVSGWESSVRNGYIPASQLAPVGNTNFLMEPHAAQALNAMIQAAAADGVTLTIGGTYRDYQTQANLYAEHEAGTHPAPVAKPGTSNHGWGLAVDLSSIEMGTPEWNWLAAHASEYGFTNPFGLTSPAEPWHWEFGQGGSTPDASVLAAAGSTPTGKKQPQVSQLASERYQTSMALTPLGLAGAQALPAVVGSLFAPQAYRRLQSSPLTRGKRPTFTGDNAAVKEQLYLGFMAAGRPDLAHMVNTRDFNTWIQAESGWNPYSVSQPYDGIVNYGLFQFRGHDWEQPYIKGDRWTADPYTQAKLVTQYFQLSVQDIHTYAEQIRAGTYNGWG